MLSQTFKFVVTYDGEPNAGVPTEFIAKFLNPDPAFSFFRMVCGSQGMTAFQQEDWCYANEFYKKAGVRSVFSLENKLLDALHMYSMSLKGLECPVSKLVNSDTCPRPTAGRRSASSPRTIPSARSSA